MPAAPASEWQVYAGFLPEGPPDQDTEFAFIEGVAFVNAAKHEEVVARHCADRDRCREALATVTALLEQQTGFYGGPLPIDEPWDPIDHEINEAVRQAKDALAAPSSRTEAPR